VDTVWIIVIIAGAAIAGLVLGVVAARRRSARRALERAVAARRRQERAAATAAFGDRVREAAATPRPRREPHVPSARRPVRANRTRRLGSYGGGVTDSGIGWTGPATFGDAGGSYGGSSGGDSGGGSCGGGE
jgi:hypothetical protein